MERGIATWYIEKVNEFLDQSNGKKTSWRFHILRVRMAIRSLVRRRRFSFLLSRGIGALSCEKKFKPIPESCFLGRYSQNFTYIQFYLKYSTQKCLENFSFNFSFWKLKKKFLGGIWVEEKLIFLLLRKQNVKEREKKPNIIEFEGSN